MRKENLLLSKVALEKNKSKALCYSVNYWRIGHPEWQHVSKFFSTEEEAKGFAHAVTKSYEILMPIVKVEVSHDEIKPEVELSLGYGTPPFLQPLEDEELEMEVEME